MRRWTKELDDFLVKAINEGKRHDEIGLELKLTKKSIQQRCFRLKLKTVYSLNLSCKQCKKEFTGYKREKRQFCSNSCANTFSSTGRIRTIESKDKTRKTLLEKRKNKPKIIKIKVNRICKSCSEPKIFKKHKTICDDCRSSYYEFYRPSCEFKFDINLYKDQFDFSLIQKYGWYSPSNKGNNLNGVSKDHLYSVKDGFNNKVDCEIIKHPANCKLLKHSANSSKHSKSSIYLSELMNRIKKWDEKYGKKLN